MSETAKRPPGSRTRNASGDHLGLSAERLMTQLEITTSTWSSGSGMSSMWPLRNWAFSAPASARFFGQLQHLVSHVQAVSAPGKTLLAETAYAATAAQVQDHLPQTAWQGP